MASGKRSRRWWITLAILASLVMAGAWWINRQLEPQRLTALVLKKLGSTLALDLRFEGTPHYALKPEPRLMIPDLSVRSPIDGKVFLSAKRAEISLPWATITGGEPIITRIELDAPVLDLPGLRRWLVTRPKIPFQVPTLSKGLHLTAGTISDEGYTTSQLTLDLPHLKSGDGAQASGSGRFSHGELTADFSTTLQVSTPGLKSNFNLAGQGTLEHSPTALPFKLQLSGQYLFNDDGFSVEANSLALAATSPLPSLTGKSQINLGKTLQFTLDGLLLQWPKDWPSLPDPLAANSNNLPFHLAYSGQSDLSEPLSLHLSHNDTTLDATVRIADMQQWIATSNGSPLPPLNATMRTPTLHVGSIQLQGVEVEIHDEPTPAAPVP